MRLVFCLLMLLFAAPVLAADWQVSRVRGEVVQQIGGAWKAVSRGDTIPNDRYVRTGATGRLGLARGKETIELQGDTQIRIKDAGAKLMTSVFQDFGEVSVDVERRNVQHFSIQTPFLAAVVKGTRFTVRSDTRGAMVDVSRGVVQVQDTVHDLVVDVRPGQEASVTSEAPLLVEGAGAVSVFSFTGVPVINGTTTEDVEKSEQITKTNNAGGNGVGNAFGLTKKADDAVSSSVNGVISSNNGKSGSSNAGGNGNGNAFGLSKDNGNNGNGNNGKSSNSSASSAVSAVTETASSAVDTVTSTVSTITESVKSNGNNAGGNGVGNAFGLLK